VILAPLALANGGSFKGGRDARSQITISCLLSVFEQNLVLAQDNSKRLLCQNCAGTLQNHAPCK
jgi:hypothetical protein